MTFGSDFLNALIGRTAVDDVSTWTAAGLINSAAKIGLGYFIGSKTKQYIYDKPALITGRI